MSSRVAGPKELVCTNIVEDGLEDAKGHWQRPKDEGNVLQVIV